MWFVVFLKTDKNCIIVYLVIFFLFFYLIPNMSIQILYLSLVHSIEHKDIFLEFMNKNWSVRQMQFK